LLRYPKLKLLILFFFLPVASLKESTLLGSTKEDYASVLKWASFANQDVWQAIRSALFPITGRVPYNKKAVDAGIAEAESYANVLEQYLTKHTYLVGERVTAADFVVVSVLARGFDSIWAAEFIKTHPALTRYFTTLIKQDVLAEYFPDFKFREEPIKYTPPKKEEKPKAAAAPKKEATPKKEAPVAEEPPKEKKEVHPLSLLPKSEFVLDEWKRVYSNEDTRETALPWFWKNYKPEDWSLWKVAYKYNDELTLTFMSNNLVGGFFNRLSASTKYMFGSAVVAGENNDNGIVGAFLVRGQDFAPAFEVAPDWESYDYTKLDITKPEDKAFVEDIWSWDKPVEIDGKMKEVADGKVLK
jgi:elongation factor 1-gamma